MFLSIYISQILYADNLNTGLIIRAKCFVLRPDA